MDGWTDGWIDGWMDGIPQYLQKTSGNGGTRALSTPVSANKKSLFFSAGFLKLNSIGFNGCVPSAFAYFRLRIEVERLTFSC